MPRKGPAPKRQPIVDPVFASPLVSQLVSKVLKSGKKQLAQRIVYTALEGCRDKTGTDPVITLKRALDNVKPSIEVKSRRVGGATYQVPIEVRPGRSTTLALRWLVSYAPVPAREGHVGAADERDPRRLQRFGRKREAARGHPQDGGVQPGVRALPLVAPAGARLAGRQAPPGPTPADDIHRQEPTRDL